MNKIKCVNYASFPSPVTDSGACEIVYNTNFICLHQGRLEIHTLKRGRNFWQYLSDL